MSPARSSPTTGARDVSAAHAVPNRPHRSARELRRSLAAAVPGRRPRAAPADRNEAPAGSVVISGTGPRPARRREAGDGPGQRRAHPARRAVRRPHPRALPRRHGRQAHHALVKGEDGSGALRDDRGHRRGDQAGGPARLLRPRAEYGVPDKLVEALDITTQLAMAAGLDALREAGHPAGADLAAHDDRAASCPTAGCCPRRCATRRASSSPAPSPAATASRTSWRATTRGTARRQQRALLEDLRADHGRPGHAGGDRPPRRRAATSELAARAVRVRPALPPPRARHGPQPVRRVHRRPRAEHAGQRGLRLAPPRRSPWPRTGSAPAAAAAWS